MDNFNREERVNRKAKRTSGFDREEYEKEKQNRELRKRKRAKQSRLDLLFKEEEAE